MTAPITYTVKQAAEAVGLSQSAIRQLIREHTLPARYFGNGTKKIPLIRVTDLTAWIDSLPDEQGTQP